MEDQFTDYATSHSSDAHQVNFPVISASNRDALPTVAKLASPVLSKIETVNDLDALKVLTKKIYRDGILERSLRKKLQSELDDLRSRVVVQNETSGKKESRFERKARKRREKKLLRVEGASFSRVNVGFYTLVQQLRRDLKIADEERQALRKELQLARKEIAEQAEVIKKLQHQVAYYRKKFFGKSNERGRGKETKLRTPKQNHFKNAKKGPPRRDYSHLPAQEQHSTLAPKDRGCQLCGKPYLDRGQVEISEQIERKVEAYRLELHRHKYQRACRCEGAPPFIRAPLPPRTVEGSILGDSIVLHLLLQKFLYQIPTQRSLSELRSVGLEISATTVNDTFKKLFDRIAHLQDAIVAKSCEDQHWHSDETGWRAVEELDCKRTYTRHYLWAIISKSVAAYVITKSRGLDVMDSHFEGVTSGFLTSDRFSVYRSIETNDRFKVGYCWAHVRRDFIRVFETDAETEVWASWWLKCIRILYRLNTKRLNHKSDSPEYLRNQKWLIKVTERMMKQAKREEKKLKNILQIKVIKSLIKHWTGLTNFLEHPILPLDNNKAERALRPMVLGRHAYHGSGAIWASQFAALMFSIFQTLGIWKVNEKKWLEMLFEKLKHKNDDTITDLLPWNLTPEILSRIRHQDSIH